MTETTVTALPHFFVIGAMKSGTDTLYDYLCQHPDARRATRHEVHFFDNCYDRGVEWYRSHFPGGGAADAGVTGETSPYYLLHPHAPRRAAGVLPAARVIAVLRNPVDRAYSHYQHQRAMGREQLGFAEALDLEPARTAAAWRRLVEGEVSVAEDVQHFSYLARDDYVTQLRRWLQEYPADQVCVVRAEDLYADPVPVMRKLFDFVGLEPFDGLQYRRLNARSYEGIDAATRTRLRDHYRDSARRLAVLLDEEPWWEL